MHCAGNVHYMNVRKPVIPLSKADAQLMQRSAGLVRSASAILIAQLFIVSVRCSYSIFECSELTMLIDAH